MDADVARGLALALREHTHRLHIEAERTGVVSDILHGRVNVAAYVLLLRNLLPAYEAMEATLTRHRDLPLLAGLALPHLYRAAAIEWDLGQVAPQWRHALPLLPAGAAYARGITACGAGAGLIAHAYTRYLGDLSGGLTLHRLVAPMLPQGGLRFHAFPEIADIGACKVAFRAAIDRAGALLGDWSLVLREAEAAFRYNIELSGAVGHMIAAEEVKEGLLF
jgi:heme oxygenase